MHFKMSSAIFSNLDQSKILSSGNGLKMLRKQNLIECGSNKVIIVKSLPNDKILGWPKLKEFADDKFKFDRYGRKFFKQRENAVGKGEIPFYQAIQTCNNLGIEDF